MFVYIGDSVEYDVMDWKYWFFYVKYSNKVSRFLCNSFQIVLNSSLFKCSENLGPKREGRI